MFVSCRGIQVCAESHLDACSGPAPVAQVTSKASGLWALGQAVTGAPEGSPHSTNTALHLWDGGSETPMQVGGGAMSVLPSLHHPPHHWGHSGHAASSSAS